MNGVVSDLRSKFENNLMYVINQKPPHFPSNLPNGSMYFPDGQMHPGLHNHGEQLSFSPCLQTSMMNNHNLMQSNMTRFISPQNGNSNRPNPIRTSPMVPLGSNNQKPTVNSRSINEDIALSFQATDNFPNMNPPYKSRIPTLDSGQSIVNSQNSNIYSDLMKPVNIPTEPYMSQNVSSGNRVLTPRNKRSRPAAVTRPQTPKDTCNHLTSFASTNSVQPSSTNIISNVSTGIPHSKCLPSPISNSNIQMPYNATDVSSQPMRPRMPNNAVNSYLCNRPPIMDKTVTRFPPSPLPSPVFGPTQPPAPFFGQVDNGFPLPMFHLHSKLSKLSECDRLTFPVNHGNLWGPLTLRHGDQVTEVKFELNQDNLQQIVKRSDLDIVVTSFTHRDQFRLCHWPEFLELKINGNILSLDCTLIQDLKAHMSCCIKKHCRLGSNALQFTVSKCVCCHLFQVYMVHRPTLAHALETILSKCTTSISTKTLLTEIYSRNNTTTTGTRDDNGSICVISLICPMSQVRISIPARTKGCKHVQPFDLLEFLRVQTKWPQYFCPICRVRVTFNLNEYIHNIVVDEIIKDIISQSDHNLRRVILYPDGKWKSVSEMKSDPMLATISSSIQEPYDQLVRQSPNPIRSTICSPQPIISQRSILCNDITTDKKQGAIIHPSDTCSSSILSPVLQRNAYANSALGVEQQSRTPLNTPLLNNVGELSQPKRSRMSPCRLQYNVSTSNTHNMNVVPDPPIRPPLPLEQFGIKSPESMKTPPSSSSASPPTSLAISSSQVPLTSSKPCVISHSNFPTHHGNPDVEHGVISSTVNCNGNLSIRTSTSMTVNKQASSGSSNPYSPPEFFDSHSSTTNYEDDDNTSLHLQRLIGFIDDILCEEEEYVLDTQWASFTWPSDDKSLDLLHISDIEKLL